MKRTLGILVALLALVALMSVPAAAETVEPASPVYTDPYHPSGNLPVIEENNFRSIMLVHVGEDGMTAKGVQASVEDNGIGYIGRVFDAFTIAE